MNIFGIGPMELLVVLAVALVFLGPEKLPELARALGKAVYQFQQMIEPYREEITRAMEPVDEVQRDVKQALRGVPPTAAVTTPAGTSPTAAAATSVATSDPAAAAGEVDPTAADPGGTETYTIAPPALITPGESPHDAE